MGQADVNTDGMSCPGNGPYTSRRAEDAESAGADVNF